MATAAPKLVTLRRPQDRLSPELREFLDAVIVPALVRKYLPELEEEKSLAPANEPTAYSTRPLSEAPQEKI
jgi:hypothetical protein